MTLQFDKRAGQLLSLDPNTLLTIPETAQVLDCSSEWLKIRRRNGHGPRFVRIGARRIRYRVSDLHAWLAERTHSSISEYA